MGNTQVHGDGATSAGGPDLDAPLVVVTTDAHVGPRLKEDLRPYCPERYLDEYDRFVEEYEPYNNIESYFSQFRNESVDLEELVATSVEARTMYEGIRQNATPGHYDVHERLEDMNRDGVAVEVVYHGSQNAQCFPFLPRMGGTFNAQFWSPLGRPEHELELAAAGARMYNRYLADQCSVEPERHIGLAHVPMWDIDAAVAEVEWAAGAGLRGVNFPAPKPGVRPYDDLAWDPFWAALVDHGMTLNTHDGAGINDLSVKRPHAHVVAIVEGDLVQKMFPRLIFGGVFERFPALKLVYAELQRPFSAWWTQTAAHYDAIWEANTAAMRELPRRPSEYFVDNIFLGSSLLHQIPSEIEAATRGGYASNVLWGSDYPHQEGCYRHTEDDDEETATKVALRHAFAGTPPEIAAAIIGENAVRVYGMDRDAIATVARRIGAITLRQLGRPVEHVPPEWAVLTSQSIFPEFREAAALLRS